MRRCLLGTHQPLSTINLIPLHPKHRRPRVVASVFAKTRDRKCAIAAVEFGFSVYKSARLLTIERGGTTFCARLANMRVARPTDWHSLPSRRCECVILLSADKWDLSTGYRLSVPKLREACFPASLHRYGQFVLRVCLYRVAYFNLRVLPVPGPRKESFWVLRR